MTVFNFLRTWQKLSGINTEIRDLRQEVDKLEQEKKRLAVLNAEADTPEFIEREIRDKLGLGREGETIIVLPEEDNLVKPEPTLEEEHFTNMQKWAKAFGFI
jgi:cell division protein FtsB